MNKKVIVPLILGAATLLALYLTGQIGQQEQEAAQVYGNVDIREATLSFRVAGRLAEVNVDEGARIKAGDLLATLDQEPLLNALHSAEANVAALQARNAMLHQGFGDIAGHPFLVGEAMADGVDQPGDPAKAVQASARQVGHVSHAAERHQMVRTDAMDGDAADDDHVPAMIFKTVAKRYARIKVITAEQAFLPELAYALRGFAHVRRIRGDAAGAEQVIDSLLEGRRVEGAAARNADVHRRGRRVLVVGTVGH